jgi:hypothetical protein
MAHPENLLDILRERTIVDCDTMDVEGESLLELFLLCITLTSSSCSEHGQTSSICRLHLESSIPLRFNLHSPEVLLIECETFQTIAYFELQKPKHETTIRESKPLATALWSKYPNVPVKELFVEISVYIPRVSDQRYLSNLSYNRWSNCNLKYRNMSLALFMFRLTLTTLLTPRRLSRTHKVHLKQSES